MSASNTNASIVSVGVSSSDYSEDGKKSSQILNDLQSGVGEFAKVHKLRNEKGADLVSVWADFSDACGLGYENDAIDSGTNGAEHYSAWGFSVLSTPFRLTMIRNAPQTFRMRLATIWAPHMIDTSSREMSRGLRAIIMDM